MDSNSDVRYTASEIVDLLMQGETGLLSSKQINDLIKALPHIDEKQLVNLGESESSCPICFTPYLALIAQEELALAMESPAHPVDMIGITKLSQPWQCGHMFCKRDIGKWITDGHDSCPLCRQSLGNQEQANESSTDFIRQLSHWAALNPQQENPDRTAQLSGMYS